jgi:uncharacterized membrane protein YdfJ with MMPL/SSD domain
MIWERVAALVRTRPGWILGISLGVLAAPAMALPSLRLSFDLTRELPPESDSVQGIELLDRSFGAGQVQPVVVIVRSRQDMWTDPSFAAIDDLGIDAAIHVTKTFHQHLRNRQVAESGVGARTVQRMRVALQPRRYGCGGGASGGHGDSSRGQVALGSASPDHPRREGPSPPSVR